MAMRMMFGGHMDKSDHHQVGLTEEFVVSFLISAGFAEAHRVTSFNNLGTSLPSGNLSARTDLNILTYRLGGVPELLRTAGKIVSIEDLFVDALGHRAGSMPFRVER